MNLLADHRGSVAVMAGVMAPVMVMTLAMGIEVTSWSVTKVDLQRAADVAAWAGAAQYQATQNGQTATNTAAQVAEINGVSGVNPRTWNAAGLTTSDNMITAQVVSGVRNAADPAIQVTVSQRIHTTFSRIFPSAPSAVTVTATAIAELVSAPVGPQPCLVALKTTGTGITDDIDLSGSADVSANNCSVRANTGVSLSGSSTINVNGTYAGGSITTSGSASVTGGEYPNDGTIPDPYANDTVVQTAFSELTAGTTPGPNYSNPNLSSSARKTISPGTYPGLTTSGSSALTLNPGTYYVTGNVNFSGSSTVTGTNVTILAKGTIAASGSTSLAITAPTTASGVGIPGMLFGSPSTGSSSYSGSSAFPLTGVIYYPNGNLTFSGSSSSDGPNACSEVVAGTITLSGSSDLSTTGCTPYGTLPFGSSPNTFTVALVQ